MMKSIALSIICAACAVALHAGIVRSSAGSSHIEFAKMQREPSEPLPDGCIAVKWLESDGTAYINTGIKMERTYGFLIDFTTFSGAGKTYMQYLCGGYAQSSRNFYCQYQWANSGRYLSIQMFAAGSRVYSLACGTMTEQRHVMISDPTGAFYVDGVLMHDGEAYGFPESNPEKFKPPFGVFNVTKVGDSPYMTTPAAKPIRVHRCALFDGEKFLFDGIPVRYEEDGRGYLYDRVSGLLFGSATDVEFTIGPNAY